MSLELDPVPDLLAGLAQIPHPGTRIGFALEPQAELESRARAKLVRKELDAIVANPLETMESDQIDGQLHLADGTCLKPPGGRMSKGRFADWLVQAALSIHQGRGDSPPA